MRILQLSASTWQTSPQKLTKIVLMGITLQTVKNLTRQVTLLSYAGFIVDRGLEN
jgi:hypothetical protein